MDEQPEPDDWPEGRLLAELYAQCYGIPYAAALELVSDRWPVRPGRGGWISGPCEPGT